MILLGFDEAEENEPKMMDLQSPPGGTYIPPDVRSQREKKRQDNRKKRYDECMKYCHTFTLKVRIFNLGIRMARMPLCLRVSFIS